MFSMKLSFGSNAMHTMRTAYWLGNDDHDDDDDNNKIIIASKNNIQSILNVCLYIYRVLDEADMMHCREEQYTYHIDDQSAKWSGIEAWPDILHLEPGVSARALVLLQIANTCCWRAYLVHNNAYQNGRYPIITLPHAYYCFLILHT